MSWNLELDSSLKRVKILMEKGVKVLNPQSVYVGEEVDLGRISGDDVTIYPNCRIHGKKTVISKGSRIGTEGPVTILDVRVGPHVELKSGFFENSVFLQKSVAGYGSHVREGCIFEEEASCAHSCGLKQTILFPFVTLGSLINFCDCLIAGGRSRKEHSEVGSSYVHFNFTPHYDKATPSLFGDVPRGVMLREPPIFLGGQGGAVGPIRLGYGNVVAAGSILRKDYLDENKLIMAKKGKDQILDFRRSLYPDLKRIVANNVIYLSNLKALKEWYRHVRFEFLKKEEFGEWIYEGLIETVDISVKERLKRLNELVFNLSFRKTEEVELKEGMRRIDEIFLDEDTQKNSSELKEKFKERILSFCESGLEYVQSIKSLNEESVSWGVRWLTGVIENYLLQVDKVLPSFGILTRFRT
ncbi:MAG: UDP-N-acetylglucosamine pyrophosphorylase [Desulfobacterota bacterium]|nr:UDP-N-acetylglucosamine pyrophosphorylase [Thermodesulfobacteriota bacterium]MDW8001263.1 UDP-N-acetylglucosamine pyrophosphorylase [Deltaproteobacteria bacterium]